MPCLGCSRRLDTLHLEAMREVDRQLPYRLCGNRALNRLWRQRERLYARLMRASA